jgi:hypothetical protein
VCASVYLAVNKDAEPENQNVGAASKVTIYGQISDTSSQDSLPVSRLAAWLSGGLGKTGAPRPLRPLTLAATEQGGGGKEAEK